MLVNDTKKIDVEVKVAEPTKIEVDILTPSIKTVAGLDVDLAKIGYTEQDINDFVLDINDSIEYSKTLYDAWDASRINATSLYQNNTNLVYAPHIDTSNVTNMVNMYYRCTNLRYAPLLDTSNVVYMQNMYYSCSNIKIIPQHNTSNVTNVAQMFQAASIVTIPLLDFSNVINASNFLTNCGYVKNLGGFKNIKISFNLSSCTLLTHDSLMNVINNLYDLTANGLNGQTLTIGSTNMAKLTADEIAIATNKGWTIK